MNLAENWRDQGYISGTALSREVTMENFCRTIASDSWICLDLLLLFSSSLQCSSLQVELPIEKIHNLFHVCSFSMLLQTSGEQGERGKRGSENIAKEKRRETHES